MKHVALRVTADSPLAIRSVQSPGGATRASYIPGSSLVGGLTMFYRLLHEQNSEMFASLFLNERVLYPNLYPAIFVDSRGSKSDKGIKDAIALQDRDKLPVFPVPQTAQSCKRHPGFLFPYTDKNDGHGVRDTLIDWGLFKLAEADQAQALTIMRAGKYCRHILHGAKSEQVMDHFDGYYRRSDIVLSDRIAAQPDSYTSLQTHTGIDRESGTVQDGILYNRQVFEDGMRFWGEILFPDDDNDELLTHFTAFLEEIRTMGQLRLGTGRSRGMGKVSLVIEAMETEENRFTTFSKRLYEFNKTFHDRAAFFKMDIPSDRYFFAITLHSPLILYDDLLRYRGTIDADTLLETLPGYTIPGLELIFHAASVRRVTGWQELWGTPRAAEYAIESGSAFLFTCSSPPDDELRKALFALEEQGMGKRQSEGFGRVCISDSFHQLVQQEGIHA